MTNPLMLAKEQYIGASVLLLMAVATWLFLALYPQNGQSPIGGPQSPWAADSLRRDSLMRAGALRDSLREARWEHKKDSFRRVDSLRFAQWSRERQLRYDSFRLADSLWRDSMGIIFPRHEKKDTVLDLNHCDTTELMYIRGIGPYKARCIVRYRTQLGGFYSPAQLTDPPLAQLMLDSLLGCFTASPEDIRTINVNTCGIDELAAHPYLRYSQAKAIYTLRRRFVRLDSVSQLSDLPELNADELVRIGAYLSFE